MGATRRFLQVAVTITIWIAALFLGARRLGWERGWISVAVYLVGMGGIGVAVRRANPELIAERAKWKRKDTKPFDRIFLAILLPLIMLQPAVAGWDAGCAACVAWPFWLVYPGAALFLGGSALTGWPLAVNRHAETTVRIQKDRGHTVVTSGPYRYVRHPMYVGVILLYIALALLWGSRWAMAMSAAVSALFVWRTAMEDRTLRRELAGYAEYTAQTRYRLLPGVW